MDAPRTPITYFLSRLGRGHILLPSPAGHLVALFLAIFCLLAVPACLNAAQQNIQDEIDNYRNQIRRLQENIAEQQKQRDEKRENERNLLGELEAIDARLRGQQKKVEDLEVKVNLQQMLINLKQEEISNLEEQRSTVLNHLIKRSSAFYKMGQVGFLNVAFSSKSIPDLLKFHDAFQTLVTYDRNIILTYRSKIDELQRANEAQALEVKLLQDFITEAQEERKKIDTIKAEKEQLLAHIRTEKQLHEQAAKEMEEASEEISKTLLSLKAKEIGSEKPFANSKGRLRPPLAGKVITYFNQEKFNRLGLLRKSSGIAIAAEDGTKVQAIADGMVIFAGYLRGYGNTVIIHHGFQYYSITSRLESIPLKEGDLVKAGTTLGKASETAALVDEGVYFEIRHGKISEDPLEWLDTRKLDHSKNFQEFNQG